MCKLLCVYISFPIWLSWLVIWDVAVVMSCLQNYKPLLCNGCVLHAMSWKRSLMLPRLWMLPWLPPFHDHSVLKSQLFSILGAGNVSDTNSYSIKKKVSHMGNPVGGMTKIIYCGTSNFITVTVSLFHNSVVVAGIFS